MSVVVPVVSLSVPVSEPVIAPAVTEKVLVAFIPLVTPFALSARGPTDTDGTVRVVENPPEALAVRVVLVAPFHMSTTGSDAVKPDPVTVTSVPGAPLVVPSVTEAVVVVVVLVLFVVNVLSLDVAVVLLASVDSTAKWYSVAGKSCSNVRVWLVVGTGFSVEVAE